MSNAVRSWRKNFRGLSSRRRENRNLMVGAFIAKAGLALFAFRIYKRLVSLNKPRGFSRPHGIWRGISQSLAKRRIRREILQFNSPN